MISPPSELLFERQVMGLKSDIESRVREQLRARYKISGATTVPTRQSLTFGATAKKMWARALYIDIRSSRRLVSQASALDALKVHKSFLYAVAKCVRDQGGEPRSFGGDSVLSFFPGKGVDNATRAVRAAMKIRYAIDYIVNPLVEEKLGLTLSYGLGIGQGEIHVGKSGVAGDEHFQDLLWLGFAVYHALEYGNKASRPEPLWVSNKVYGSLKKDGKLITSDGKNMWTSQNTKLSFGTFTIYKTSYYIVLS